MEGATEKQLQEEPGHYLRVEVRGRMPDAVDFRGPVEEAQTCAAFISSTLYSVAVLWQVAKRQLPTMQCLHGPWSMVSWCRNMNRNAASVMGHSVLCACLRCALQPAFCLQGCDEIQDTVPRPSPVTAPRPPQGKLCCAVGEW